MSNADLRRWTGLIGASLWVLGCQESGDHHPSSWLADPQSCKGVDLGCAQGSGECSWSPCIPGDCSVAAPYCFSWGCITLREAQCACASGSLDPACKRSPEEAASLEALLDCDESKEDCSYLALGGPGLDFVMNKRAWQDASRLEKAGKVTLRPYVMTFRLDYMDYAGEVWTRFEATRTLVVDGKPVRWTLQRDPAAPIRGITPDYLALRTVDAFFDELEFPAFSEGMSWARRDTPSANYFAEYAPKGYPTSFETNHFLTAPADDYSYTGGIDCLSLDDVGPEACALTARSGDISCVGASGAPKGCLKDDESVCALASRPHELCEGKCEEALCTGGQALTCRAGLATSAVICDEDSECVVDGAVARCIPTCASREDPACGAYLCDVASSLCEHECVSDCAAGFTCVEGQCQPLLGRCTAESCFPYPCDSVTGRCAPWCNDALGMPCAEGALCRSARDDCAAPCSASDDPACKGFRCSDDGFCETFCDGNGCSTGYTCPRGTTTCRPSPDCTEDAECEPFACGADGTCIAQCATNEDCAGGRICDRGACTERCNFPNDPICKSFACNQDDPDAAHCAGDCRASSECAEGFYCADISSGASGCIAVPTCDAYHADVCRGYACDVERKRCLEKCETDAECAPDSIFGCHEGRCG